MSEKPSYFDWTPYEGGFVRVQVPARYLPEWERYGAPDDLHPDLYPELFEFREEKP